jgi:hypothetical protein
MNTTHEYCTWILHMNATHEYYTWRLHMNATHEDYICTYIWAINAEFTSLQTRLQLTVKIYCRHLRRFWLRALHCYDCRIYWLLRAGLPDGMYIFIPKIPWGYALEGLGMEDIGLFYGHLEYFVVIWYILWSFT